MSASGLVRGRWGVVGTMLAATVGLVFIAYWPAMFGPFLFDDVFDIDENPAIRSLWPPWSPLASARGLPVRPLPYYTFAINYAIHKLEPLGWHLTNVALHLANGLLVGRCLTGILTLTIHSGRLAIAPLKPWLVAWAIASLWLVHPLATQPVAYIYQRIELLAALAIVAALSVFLHHRTTGGLAAIVTISAIGMLCKETAVAIPPIILLTDWLVVSWQPERPWGTLLDVLRRRPLFYVSLLATCGIAGAVVWWQRQVYDEFADPSWSSLNYAINQPQIILHYLRLAFAPSGQCFDYGMPASNSLARLAPGLIALAAALVIAVWWVGRKPLGAYAILLFLTLLGPSSSVIPVNDLCVEHRMYLPLAVVVAGAVLPVIAWRPPPPRLFAVAVASVAMLLTGISHARTDVYRSRLAAWADVVSKAPRNQRALLWLGISLEEDGHLAAAFDMFGRCIAVDPDSAESAKPHAFRAALLGRSGDLEACVREAARAVVLRPNLVLGWSNLCRGLLELQQLEKAVEAGREALRLARGSERLVAVVNLGSVLAAQGRIKEAGALWQMAQNLGPAHPLTRQLQGRILQAGQPVDQGRNRKE